MKKLVLFLFVSVAALSCVMSYGFQSTKDTVNGLTLANIEAISRAEQEDCNWRKSSDSHGVTCYDCVRTGSGNSCQCGDSDC